MDDYSRAVLSRPADPRVERCDGFGTERLAVFLSRLHYDVMLGQSLSLAQKSGLVHMRSMCIAVS